MAMTSLSIILTVFVLQLHHVGPHQKRVPRLVWTLLINVFAPLVCLFHVSRRFQSHGHGSSINNDQCVIKQRRSRDHDRPLASPLMSKSEMESLSGNERKTGKMVDAVNGKRLYAGRKKTRRQTTSLDDNFLIPMKGTVIECNLPVEQNSIRERKHSLCENIDNFLGCNRKPEACLSTISSVDIYYSRNSCALNVDNYSSILSSVVQPVTRFIHYLGDSVNRIPDMRSVKNLTFADQTAGGHCTVIGRHSQYQLSVNQLSYPDDLITVHVCNVPQPKDMTIACTFAKKSQFNAGNSLSSLKCGNLTLCHYHSCPLPSLGSDAGNTNANISNLPVQRTFAHKRLFDHTGVGQGQRSCMINSPITGFVDQQIFANDGLFHTTNSSVIFNVNAVNHADDTGLCSTNQFSLKPRTTSTLMNSSEYTDVDRCHSYRKRSISYQFSPRKYNDLVQHHLVKIVRHDEDVDREDVVTEWRVVAHIMDRLFFWLFLFLAIVSSVVILIIKPLNKPEKLSQRPTH